MGKNKKALALIVILLLQSLTSFVTAKPNIQVLKPTGYSVDLVYDDTPFYLDNGVMYALPKGLNVKLVGLSGLYLVYCELPDGSRGYMQELYFGGSTVTLSKKINNKAKPGEYEIVSIGSWKYNREMKRCTFTADQWQLKNVESGAVVTIRSDASGVKLNRPSAIYRGQLPEETISFDTIVIVENPDDLGNLVGLSMAEVENYLGSSKAFVGDALTDVGYAYAFYRNVAYIDGEDRFYGLNVYYDKNSVCVAAKWDSYRKGKLNKPEEYPVKLPAEGTGVEPVEIVHATPKNVSRYDCSIVPTQYRHHDGFALKGMTFRRFSRDIIAGENVPSTLLTIFLLYGLFLLIYKFFLKHTTIGSNGFHIGVTVLIGLLFLVIGVYGLSKFRFVDKLWGIPALIFMVCLMIRSRCSDISSHRCPYCYYYYGKVQNIVRQGGYEKNVKSSRVINRKYSEIGELKSLSDEQIRRWETVFKHELHTSQYGKYKEYIICPRCIAQWVCKYETCENEVYDSLGYTKHVREEIWKLRKKEPFEY